MFGINSRPKKAFNNGDDRYKLNAYADYVVARTIDRIKDSKKTGKPLVLMLGENHESMSHHIAQMLIVEKLAEKGIKLAAGVEQPHDSIRENTFYNETYGDYTYALKAFIASCPFQKIATAMKYKTLIDNKITTVFNDAARTNPSSYYDPYYNELVTNIYADLSDPITQKAARNLGLRDLSKKISLIGRSGMYLRNFVMAALADHFLDKERPEVFIQFTGAAHTEGHAKQNLPYEESLAELYKKQGYEILSVNMPPSIGYNQALREEEYIEPKVLSDMIELKNSPFLSIDFLDNILDSLGRKYEEEKVLAVKGKWLREFNNFMRKTHGQKNGPRRLPARRL